EPADRPVHDRQVPSRSRGLLRSPRLAHRRRHVSITDGASCQSRRRRAASRNHRQRGTLMKLARLNACIALAGLLVLPAAAEAEILALVNYETKSKESLKVLKRPIAAPARKEGLAIIDVDPASKTFGKIVKDIPLPGDLVAHHIFYNRDSSKAYVTALGKPELRVIDMKDPALTIKV